MHCFGGRSRSAAFIAAYLMCNFGWSYEKTIGIIVAGRPVASVNKGFEKQLRAYAQTNYDVYATQQMLLRNRIKALHDIRGLSTDSGTWKVPSKGGNKRSWGDRDSLSGKNIMLVLRDQEVVEEAGDMSDQSDDEELGSPGHEGEIGATCSYFIIFIFLVT